MSQPRGTYRSSGYIYGWFKKHLSLVVLVYWSDNHLVTVEGQELVLETHQAGGTFYVAGQGIPSSYNSYCEEVLSNIEPGVLGGDVEHVHGQSGLSVG